MIITGSRVSYGVIEENIQCFCIKNLQTKNATKNTKMCNCVQCKSCHDNSASNCKQLTVNKEHIM